MPRETIKDHRWAVQFIESDNRPFAYTVGLHEKHLPEWPAEHIDCGERHLLEVVEVEHPDVHLKFALRLYGSNVRALQLLWADDAGRWPWDRGWGHGRRRQPVLGVRGPVPN